MFKDLGHLVRGKGVCIVCVCPDLGFALLGLEELLVPREASRRKIKSLAPRVGTRGRGRAG